MDNTQFHNNKFLFYNSYNAFKDDLEDNPNHPSLIDPKSIVFIKDKQIIWTHGVEFTANSESFANLIELLRVQIESLTNSIQPLIESKITEFLDIRHEGYEEALQTASDDLASAKEKLDDLERRMRELLESGLAAEDYYIKILGILMDYNSELQGVKNGIVTFQAWMNWANAQFGQMITSENIANYSESIWSKIIDLVKNEITEELKVLKPGEDTIDIVGRILAAGYLKDYVTHEELGKKWEVLSTDYATLADDVKKLLELVGTQEAVVGWIKAVLYDDEVLGYITQYLTNDGDFITKIVSDEVLINAIATRISGDVIVDGQLTLKDVDDEIDNKLATYTTLTKEGITITDNNSNKIQIVQLENPDIRLSAESNTRSTFSGGIRHWVDTKSDGLLGTDSIATDGETTKNLYEKDTSNFELNIDGSAHIGRLKRFTVDLSTFYKHPITVDKNGNVTIIGDVIKNAKGDEINWNLTTYKTQHMFAVVQNDKIPSTLTDMLPRNDVGVNVDPIWGNLYSVGNNSYTVGWTKSALSGAEGSSVFMILREYKVDSNENIQTDPWQGPYKISGADGKIGIDSDFIHFIYTRTETKTNPDLPESSDHLGSWKERASEAEIDKDHRYSWMAFSTKKTDSTWTDFQGPVLWSVWGDTGIDGDGIEYIFCLTNDLNAPAYDPSTWEALWEEEYIPDEYKSETPSVVNKWYDDPQEMTLGQYLWVSKRTYTWPKVDGLTDKSQPKEWGRYCKPSIWSHWAEDGVVNGYFIDIDNPSIAVSVNSRGHLATEEDEDRVPNIERPIIWNINRSGGNAPTYVDAEDNDFDTLMGGASSVNPKYTVNKAAEVEYIGGARPAGSNWYYVQMDTYDGKPCAKLTIVNYRDVVDHNEDPENALNLYGDTGTNYSKLDLLKNSIRVILNFTVYEAYDSLDHTNDVKYEFTKTFYVHGVYTGADGAPGSTYDLKLSTKNIYVDTNLNTRIPTSINISCLHTVGDVFTVYYPTEPPTNGTDGRLFRFAYALNGVEGTPSITGDYSNVVEITERDFEIDNSWATSNTIVIYLFAKKNGRWVAIDSDTIGFVLGGSNGVGLFVSTIFCRTSIDKNGYIPDTPTGASADKTLPDPLVVTLNSENIYPMDGDGNYMRDLDPVKWSDGIPDGKETLWESRRTFYTTGEAASGWTVPRKVLDVKGYQVRYSTMETNLSLGNPTDNPANWFDPETASGDVIWDNVIWRAERWETNGIWSRWYITRIKGEKGDGRFVSTIFCRSFRKPAAPKSAESNEAGWDENAVYATGMPGDIIVHPFVLAEGELWDSDLGPRWHDAIPSGDYILWASSGTFVKGVTGVLWSEPVLMTDTETWDVEFSPLNNGIVPDPPIYYSDDNINYNALGPEDEREGNYYDISRIIWFDPTLDVDPDNETNRIDLSEMVWKAERSIRNGVPDENWTITKIKGEKGDPSDGYSFDCSLRGKITVSRGLLNDWYGADPSSVRFTVMKNGSLVLDWTLLVYNTDDNDWSSDCIDNSEYCGAIVNSNLLIVNQHLLNTVSVIKCRALLDQDDSEIGQIDIPISTELVDDYYVDIDCIDGGISVNNDGISPNKIEVHIKLKKFYNGVYEIDVPYNTGILNPSGTSGWYIQYSSDKLNFNNKKFTFSGAKYEDIKNGIIFNVWYYSNSLWNLLTTKTVGVQDNRFVIEDDKLPKTYSLNVTGAAIKYEVATKKVYVNFGSHELLENGKVLDERTDYEIKQKIYGVSRNSFAPIPNVSDDDDVYQNAEGEFAFYIENVNEAPSNLLFIAHEKDNPSNVFAYAYILTTIEPETPSASEIAAQVDTILGEPGKMFYMCGEYDDSVTYTDDGDMIPLVYFHQLTYQNGEWWYLSPFVHTNVNGETHYAPGHPNETLNPGRLSILDKYGRSFNCMYDADSNAKYRNHYWIPADNFNVVIAEGIFTDFAKLGSAIVSGDFMFSQHGKIDNLYYGTGATVPKSYYPNPNNSISYPGDGSLVPAYTKFSPIKDIKLKLDKVWCSANDTKRIGPSFTIPEGCALYGTVKVWCELLIHEYGTNLTATNPDGKISYGLCLKPLKNDIFYNEGGEDINLQNIATGTSEEQSNYGNGQPLYSLNINVLDIDRQKTYTFCFKNKTGSAMRYTVELDLHLYKIVNGSTRSTGVGNYGVFEPNWCVDLRTGKMIAGLGNFVVEPSGDLTIGKGTFTVDGNTGAIIAANGNLVIDLNGEIFSKLFTYVIDDSNWDTYVQSAYIDTTSDATYNFLRHIPGELTELRHYYSSPQANYKLRIVDGSNNQRIRIRNMSGSPIELYGYDNRSIANTLTATLRFSNFENKWIFE